MSVFQQSTFNCNRGMLIVFTSNIRDLTELSFMPTNCRFLIIAFTSVALGTMATFWFARLKTRVGLTTNRFIMASLTWDFYLVIYLIAYCSHDHERFYWQHSWICQSKFLLKFCRYWNGRISFTSVRFVLI